MAQIGTFGHYDVPVYEAADVTSPYVHIAGVGYLALEDISNISKPTYVVHAGGSKYAVAKSLDNLEIDYFDDGDLVEWSQSDPNNSYLVDDSYAGAQAFYMDGYTQADSLDNSLPHYPQDALNGEWQQWWKATWDPDDLRCDFRWAVENGNESTAYMTRITDGCIRLRVLDPDVNSAGSKIYIENFIDFNEDQWYRVHYDWTENADGSHDITISVYNASGTLIDQQSATIESTYAKSGRGMFVEAFAGTYIKIDQMAVVA